MLLVLIRDAPECYVLARRRCYCPRPDADDYAAAAAELLLLHFVLVLF